MENEHMEQKDYHEEYAQDLTYMPKVQHEERRGSNTFGYIGIVCVALGLFFSPVTFGLLSIFFGFLARGQRSTTLGTLSIVLGLFLVAFGLFYRFTIYSYFF